MNSCLRSSRRIAGLLVCLCLSACLSVKWGTPIVTPGLEDLKVGESTRADVLLALGQPRGEGGAVMGSDRQPREIVFYEYMTNDGSRIELEILLVFMARERYDGHLWFASTERVREQGAIPGIRAADKTEIGRFPSPAPLEADFQRGRTSRAAVIEALGSPVGSGAAIIPPDHRKSEVLYYEDIAFEHPKQDGDEWAFEVRQRIMLVMIVDGVFDGFLWFSSLGAPRAKSQ